MQKRAHFYTVALFLALLGVFALAFWILPDRDFSEQENRGLQGMPRPNGAAILSGKFADAVNDYFADQFPMRDSLVALKGLCELARGTGENDGILLGRDGHLARGRFGMRTADGEILSDTDYFDPARVRLAAEALSSLGERLDCPFTVMAVGRAIDVCAASFSYPSCLSDRLLRTFDDPLADGLSRVDVTRLLRERHEAGEAVYYRTDHHWTTLGAYYAYAALMREMGRESEILPAKRFQICTVDGFYGTAWSAGGMKFVAPDVLEIWTAGDEGDYCVVADGRELDGFYSEGYLARKDKYSVFLDGTHDVVTVTRRDGAPRERLLILRDSYAAAIAPFLARHFDLVLLNLSSTRTDFRDLSGAVEEYGADRAVLIYGMENILTADRVTGLH